MQLEEDLVRILFRLTADSENFANHGDDARVVFEEDGFESARRQDDRAERRLERGWGRASVNPIAPLLE